MLPAKQSNSDHKVRQLLVHVTCSHDPFDFGGENCSQKESSCTLLG